MSDAEFKRLEVEQVIMTFAGESHFACLPIDSLIHSLIFKTNLYSISTVWDYKTEQRETSFLFLWGN